MFPMTVTITNAAQLNAIMSLLAAPAEQPAAPVVKAVKESKPAPKVEKAEKVEATVTDNGASHTPDLAVVLPPPAAVVAQPVAETVSAEPLAPPAPATESVTVPVTLEDVKAVFLKLVGKSRESAVKLLAGFGCAKLTEAKPEQYAAILNALNKALA